MFRFKIKETDVKKVKTYLKKKDGPLPMWGFRFKSDLKLNGDKLTFKGKEVIPMEKQDAFLRKRLYSKEADLATSRDACFYTLQKEVVGISRRTIMEFLRKQKTLEARAALPEPKQHSGKKLKKKQFAFEFDLCFIRKADLVRANKRFEDRHGHNLVYCVTTVEKATSICRLGLVHYKDQKLVTPMVIAHIKSICSEIGVPPAECVAYSDKGTEFGKAAISKIVKTYKHVSMGGCVEKKNAQLQASFYQILKNRQALTIKTALAKTQNLLNKTYSHTHKRTPEEVGEQVKSGEYDAIKGYNDKRKTHISNSKTKELQIGDYVRLQIAGAKVMGIGF